MQILNFKLNVHLKKLFLVFVSIQLLTFIFSGHSNVNAQNVDIQLTNAQPLADFLDTTVGDIELQLEEATNELFNVFDSQGYLRLLADAGSFTNRGLGVDYSTAFKFGTFGANGNASLAFNNKSFNGFKDIQNFDFKKIDPQNPLAFPAVGASGFGGVNLGMFGFHNINVYGNYFKHGMTFKQFRADLRNYGFHVQYRLLAPNLRKKRPVKKLSRAIFSWTGIGITTGIEQSTMRLRLNQNFEFNETVSGSNGQSARVDLTATGKAEITSKTFNIPIEVTTSGRFLYVLTLFGGMGVDITPRGLGSYDIDLNGTLETDDPNNPGQKLNLGSASINVADENKPSPFGVRFLGGVQLNLGPVKLALQGNLRPQKTFGLNLGLKLAY